MNIAVSTFSATPAKIKTDFSPDDKARAQKAKAARSLFMVFVSFITNQALRLGSKVCGAATNVEHELGKDVPIEKAVHKVKWCNLKDLV